MRKSNTSIDARNAGLCGLIAVVILLAVVLEGCGESVEGMGHNAQPVAFNHSLHTGDMGMDCMECHQTVMKGRKATLPPGQICRDCHEEPQGETAEEARLVSLLEGEEELNWQRVYVLPKHVYFSHFRHVTLAQIVCQECHGEMKELTRPPTRAATGILDMDFCMDCHTERRTSNDCLTCHI